MAFPIDWQNPRSGFTHGQTGRSRYILSQGAMRDKGLLASLGALTQAEQGGDPELLRRARQDIMSNPAIQVIRGSEDPMQDFDIIAEAADENRLETKGAPGPKGSVGPEIPTTQGEHPMPTGPAPILEAALKAIKLPATPTTAPAQPAPVGPQPELAQPAAPVPTAAKPLAQWTGRDYADWEAEAKSYVTGEVKQPERLAKLIEQAEKDYSMDWWGTEQSRWSPKTIASEIGRRRRRGIPIEDIARDLGGFPEEGKLEKDIKRAEANISAITGGEKGDASRKRIYEGALKRDPEGKFFGPDLNRIREQLGNLGEYPNPYRLGKLEEDKRELSREDADHAQAAIDKVFTGKVKARDVPNPDYDPLATEGPTAQKTIKGQETVLEPGAMEFQTGNAYRKKYPELGTKEAISRIIYKGKEEFTGLQKAFDQARESLQKRYGWSEEAIREQWEAYLRPIDIAWDAWVAHDPIAKKRAETEQVKAGEEPVKEEAATQPAEPGEAAGPVGPELGDRPVQAAYTSIMELAGGRAATSQSVLQAADEWISVHGAEWKKLSPEQKKQLTDHIAKMTQPND